MEHDGVISMWPEEKTSKDLWIINIAVEGVLSWP